MLFKTQEEFDNYFKSFTKHLDSDSILRYLLLEEDEYLDDIENKKLKSAIENKDLEIEFLQQIPDYENVEYFVYRFQYKDFYPILLKISICYSSYDGYDFESVNSIQVQPVIKQVVEYEST